jgi:cell wall-associated NlpC family hydrolase
VRMRTRRAVMCSLTISAFSAIGAPAALAGGTGGVAAVEPTPAKPAAPPLHLSPITAKTPNLAYKGPVYEKTATGEVVPFAVPAKASTTTGTAASSTSTSDTAAPSTGGIAPTSSESAASSLTASIPSELTIGDGMTSATGPTLRPELLVPGTTARFIDGIAAAPEGVPAVIQDIIWAGNELIGLPYIYGGGHGSFVSPGYDCSGTVSFALHGADLLSVPKDSSEFEAWGSHGAGRWIAIFSNPGHAYMTVAGLRLDTSPAEDPADLEGPRWRPLRQTNAGFIVRHPLGL